MTELKRMCASEFWVTRKNGSFAQLICIACQKDIASKDDGIHREFSKTLEKEHVFKGVVDDYFNSHAKEQLTLSTKKELLSTWNLEKSGNFEQAAHNYGHFGLWNQAGRVRRELKTTTVKHVTVNINQLLEYVSTHGLAIPYKCHSCGASSTIDKNTESGGLKFCSYCGSMFDMEIMKDYIQSVIK